MIKSALKTVFLFILLIFFSLQVSLTKGTSPESNSAQRVLHQDAADEMLQFVSGEHVLGFRKGDVFIASGDHALRVEFLNSRQVSPKEDGISEDKEKNLNKTASMRKITYNNLWAGVDLVYENYNSGVVKSTYTVKPGALPDSIRLRYNAPVKVDSSGNLVISFETGEMKESRPVAWQEIEGERIPVEVNFSTSGEKEVGFDVDSYDPQYTLIIDPVLIWNTFLGSSGDDYGYAIAVDESGNVYVAGESYATWGTPVNAFAGSDDAFAAKLNSSGVLEWNTFLGSSSYDYGNGIAVDGSGNVYVAGWSGATWGTPVNAHAGSGDAFAAKLNTSGVLQWNTFMGSSFSDSGEAIAVDGSGNVYVAGWSDATWGAPVNAHAGDYDAFAAKLNTSGVLQWNTFLGSSSDDFGNGIAVDGNGNVYVAGSSFATWGTPVNAHAGGGDVFAAKLNTSGVLQWNTFMGSSDYDYGRAIAVDGSGNVYVVGNSYATWGTPVNAFAGGCDAFAAKLNTSGVLQWNMFMGSSSDDVGEAIAVDGNGNVYVAGESYATWGTPLNAHAGDYDAFAAKLNTSGVLQWNTFLGSSSNDEGYGIAVDGSGNVYVAGESSATWGTPLNAFAGGRDVFVAKIGRSWQKINNTTPETAAGGDSNENGKEELAADFGSLGLWLAEIGSPWVKITTHNADTLAGGDLNGTGGDEFVAGFSSIGLWVYDDVSGWRKINNRSPEALACGDLDGNGQEEVIADFGSIGVWSYDNNTSWRKLNTHDLEGLTCGDLDDSGQDEVVGDFGSLGVWSYYNNSSWHKLNTHNLEGLTCGDLDGNGQDEVVGDFGSIGVWSYDNSSSWRQLNNSDVSIIACGDLGGGGDEVVADFGSLGLWVYFNEIGWQKINNKNTQLLICGDADGDGLDDVIAGFGSIGLWVWY